MEPKENLGANLDTEGLVADCGWQDQIADSVGGDGPSQQPTFGQNPLLTLELLKIAGSQAIGEGRESSPPLFSLKCEKILAQRHGLQRHNQAWSNSPVKTRSSRQNSWFCA